MSEAPAKTIDPRREWGKAIGIGIALSAVIVTVLLAFLWPIVTASPKDVPIGIAGPAAVVSQFESQAPDVFALTEVDDQDAAVTAIEHRELYGALILDPTGPEVLVSSAASPVIAQQLTALAPVLQQQLNAAAAAQFAQSGAPGAPPTITVEVTDVVPLASTDERGAGLAASSLPLHDRRAARRCRDLPRDRRRVAQVPVGDRLLGGRRLRDHRGDAALARHPAGGLPDELARRLPRPARHRGADRRPRLAHRPARRCPRRGALPARREPDLIGRPAPRVPARPLGCRRPVVPAGRRRHPPPRPLLLPGGRRHVPLARPRRLGGRRPSPHGPRLPPPHEPGPLRHP